ncbi:YbaB/EbfC family nucleoid-associated protein [Nonomuraea sp. PA05]|uniref:YbaB/EbfC family nucleoid-associated protein n=1 Tax=Nonomuraea sp. PA05 TaxID=2604466 RepID=UPI0011DA847F|nr:YbaB/EbfC family nucleoid-associated protein [Nonomuraea sp. PA05]TYB59215.1 YbaB/EbfC family nucleoid-associated protein [Nonomuraea sp. PA05]
MIEQARQALAAVQASSASASESPDAEPPLRGEGQAAEGKVRAVVVAGGRLASLSVDPRVMREGSEEMCAQIMAAVNAAADGLRAQVMERATAAAGGAEIASTLLTLQQESVRQMERFTQSLDDVVARFERRQ